MLLKKIPIIQCLAHFPLQAHKTAGQKFIVLWVLTSLPVIVATILSPIPNGDTDVTLKFFGKLTEAINVSELFVYTATFLAPLLYMIFEKYRDSPPEAQIGERLTQSVRSLFKGYGIVAFIAFLLLLFTAVSFGQIKADSQHFKQSFLVYYLTNYSIPIYIFSLYCWYLTLLDGVWGGDFVDANRQSEKNAQKDFNERLRNRKSDDE